MSDQLTRESQTRAQSVRAALARAHNPTVFEDTYQKTTKPGINADFAYQEARQTRLSCCMGFDNEWLRWQLTRRGYARYFKWCLNHWWQKPLRKRKRKQRRRKHRKPALINFLGITFYRAR